MESKPKRNKIMSKQTYHRRRGVRAVVKVWNIEDGREGENILSMKRCRYDFDRTGRTRSQTNGTV
jgi:hypothetical protein